MRRGADAAGAVVDADDEEEEDADMPAGMITGRAGAAAVLITQVEAPGGEACINTLANIK